MKYTVQVAPEDCTGCGLCVEACPAKNKSQPKFKAINMAPQPPLRFTERDNFAVLPGPAGAGPHADPAEQRQELAAAPAALRVLRRLLRLRRDALRQAGQPALRRPRHRRQRHRLLLDLRRQPADDAVGGEQGRPRPGLVEQPLRGQRRVRPGLPPDHRQAERVRPRAGRRRTATCSATCWSTSLLAADQSTEKGIAEQRGARRRAEAEAGRHRPSRGPRSSTASPTCWSSAASGSWAATAGPTTSATAAWITCWPRAATSTCWCSTRRSTRTPAARRRRPPHAPRWPTSPPAASHSPRRTWA